MGSMFTSGYGKNKNTKNCTFFLETTTGRKHALQLHHSIVLMAVMGPDYRFNYIDVGGFGRQSDGGTWSAWKFRKALNRGELDIPGPRKPPDGSKILPRVFVADAAFLILGH